MKSKEDRKQDFIKKSKDVYGNKFNYSKVEYKNDATEVEIICSNHGSFFMKPCVHARNSKFGCQQCANEFIVKTRIEKNKKNFLRDTNKIHGDKFDYSLIEYANNNTPIKIVCPHHGVFEIAPYTHKMSDAGCILCSREIATKKMIKPLQYYIDRANEKHNFKYDYSLIKEDGFKKSKQNVKIKCSNGHVFEQKFHDHINGNGCTYCSKPCYDTESFIKLCSEAHHNKYDYSKTEYIHQKTKVIVICPDHGEFLVRPTNHYNLKRGCPHCKTSHGENNVKFLLEQQEVGFIQQKTFDSCRDNGMLRFDFYLPEYNACIEYDGAQHYKPIERFGGQNYFEDIQLKDEIKNKFCESNNISLLRISYKDKTIENKVSNFIGNFIK